MKNVPAKIIQPLPLLDRILQEPELVAQVQNLEARTLGRLIGQIGLEDAGEIIALATTDQLRQIFEEDLWRAERPGEAESFDAERFGQWLEVMFGADPKAAARKLADMEEAFVVLALSRHILVLDPGGMRCRFADNDTEDAEFADKILESSLNHEFDSYLVVAKGDRYWDAVLELLTELDREHSDFLRRVLERSRRPSDGLVESEGGLYHVLTSAQQLENDAADEREQRRERQGYVSPHSAAHFLLLARRARPDEILSAGAADPITRAYFTAYAAHDGARPTPARPAAGNSLARLLQSAQVQPAPRPALPGSAASESEWPIRRALARLAERNRPLHAQRLFELNYLANVLIAGCPYQDRRFRPAEAAQAAIAACNLGLESLARNSDPGRSAEALEQYDLVRLFRFGWSRLHQEVALPVAAALQAALAALPRRLPKLSREDREHIADLEADLKRALADGTPWTGAEHLVILELLLDTPEVYALTTLLAECPTVPDALEFAGRDRPRSRSEFIHSEAQMRIVREFAESLGKKLR